MTSLLSRIYFISILLTVLSCGEGGDPEPNPMPTTPKEPSFDMDALSIIEGQQQKNIFINLRLDGTSNQDITVTLSTEDGTAKAGEDYTAISNQVITFAAGRTQENCQLQILGDEEAEQDETFRLKVISISGAKIGTSMVQITIENDDTDFSVNLPSSGYTTPDSYPDMTLIWRDEFDGDQLNEEDWTYEIGNGNSGWGNNELQFYRKENTQLLEGNLVIQAREEDYNGFQYTSSRLITRNKVNFTHGRVDIRAALPETQGLWPALWMLGESLSTAGWPRCGEIDIMELVGHDPSAVHGTVHYAAPNGAHIFVGKDYRLGGGQKFSDAYHVFSIVWEENKITWYVDDTPYYSITNQSLGDQNPYPFNDPFFFIMNVAVGGNWPGSPDGSTVFPQNMIVDYIRVFQPK